MKIQKLLSSPGLKGLVKEMHCCPSDTVPDTSETSLVQVLPVVVSTVSGHAPVPPRHYTHKYRTENIPYHSIIIIIMCIH
jgi:hypothetical protein